MLGPTFILAIYFFTESKVVRILSFYNLVLVLHCSSALLRANRHHGCALYCKYRI